MSGTGVRAAPFPLGEKRASGTYSHLDKLVNTEFYGGVINGAPATVKLVRLDNASGLTTPEGKQVAYHDAETGDVDLTAAGEVCAGVILEGQEDLVDNDLFFVQISGTASIAVGATIDAGHNADTGASGTAADGGTTETLLTTFARALAQITTSALGAARITAKLEG